MSRPALYSKHRPIALAEAREWHIPGLDLDDVRQEANVALWEATACYDPARGAFPPLARTVIRRHLRDLLQAATRQKRTAEFERHAEPVGEELESTVLHREQLREAFSNERLAQRRKWRDAKRRQAMVGRPQTEVANMSEQTEIQTVEEDGNAGWRGAEQLLPYLCRISQLQPTKGNPDKGKAHVGRLKHSLTRFGQTRPILIDSADGVTIRAGHHLTRAAEELGWTHIAAIAAEFSDDGEAIAYLMADNRLARVGDEDASVQQQLALLDLVADKLQGTGWDIDTVEQLRAESGVETAPAEAEPWQGPAAETAEEAAARVRATESYKKVPIDLTETEHGLYEEQIRLLKQAYHVRSAKDVILRALAEAYDREAAPVTTPVVDAASEGAASVPTAPSSEDLSDGDSGEAGAAPPQDPELPI